MKAHVFKLNKDLQPYIEDLLIRAKITYVIRPNGTILCDSSGKQFHRIVTRARCLKRNSEEGLPPDTTYYIDKIENKEVLQLDNPEYVRFIKM